MTDELSDLIDSVVEASVSDNQSQTIKLTLAQQNPEEIALLLESLPIEQRAEVWSCTDKEKRLSVLNFMRNDPRETLIDMMSVGELDELFEGIDAEVLVEISESLPDRMLDRAMRIMDERQLALFKDALQYDNKLTGHWVDQNMLVLPVNAKVRDAMRLLRRIVPVYADTFFLIDRTGKFSSAVKISRIYREVDHISLADLGEEGFLPLEAKGLAADAALDVQISGYTALPVIEESGKLIGRLNIKVACELVNESLESKLMASAGLDENEDLFAPVVKSSQNRAIWLGINLLTAFLASWFIGLFEATLEQVVALAVLMPVVASMGGIAGSQTLTLIIRGLALGQITKSNLKALFVKELGVGGVNGILWAIVIGIAAYVWFANPIISIVIALAILTNIIAAAIAGVLIPVVLEKLKLDPALSGSVVLTTVTDIVGFVTFLGLGTLLLL